MVPINILMKAYTSSTIKVTLFSFQMHVYMDILISINSFIFHRVSRFGCLGHCRSLENLGGEG